MRYNLDCFQQRGVRKEIRAVASLNESLGVFAKSRILFTKFAVY